MLLGIPVNIHYLYTVSVVNSTFGTLWCVVLAFNNLACFSTDMQFIRCACMLHYRFTVINNELEAIAAVWHFKRGLVVIVVFIAMINDKSYILCTSFSLILDRGDWCDAIY